MGPIKKNKLEIGSGKPTFVIAEIGSNYNKNLETAKKMIDIAKDAGVDAVKFQLFKEKRLYPDNAGTVDYLMSSISINELVKKAEVKNEIHKELKDYCDRKGVMYLCTPTDEESADFLEKLGVVAFKVASYALTHLRLLRHLAKKNKPIFLSTGASHMHEVAEAIMTIRAEGNDNIYLLQCVAQYPADIQATNLKVIDVYKDAFNCPAGISDHSLDPFVVPYAAVARGADIVEKHFTLDRNQDGPDHSFAVEPDELKKMVKGIRMVEQAIGVGEKKVLSNELELRNFTNRCVFAIKDIKGGERITKDLIDILRPGKKPRGLDAKYYDLVVNAVATDDISKGQAIKWKHIIR